MADGHVSLQLGYVAGMRRNKTCGLSKDHTVTKERWQERCSEP